MRAMPWCLANEPYSRTHRVQGTPVVGQTLELALLAVETVEVRRRQERVVRRESLERRRRPRVAGVGNGVGGVGKPQLFLFEDLEATNY